MIDTIFMMTGNILQELIKNAGFTPFIHETDGIQAALVPVPDGGETYFQQIVSKLQEAGNTVCRIMKEDFAVQISIIISGAETGLVGIAEAYERMLGMMTLRDLREGEYPPVTLLKGRPNSPHRMLIRKSIEQIHTGDYAGAKETLESLCESAVKPQPTPRPAGADADSWSKRSANISTRNVYRRHSHWAKYPNISISVRPICPRFSKRSWGIHLWIMFRRSG